MNFSIISNRGKNRRNKHHYFVCALHFFNHEDVDFKSIYYYFDELWKSLGLTPNAMLPNGHNYGPWSTHFKTYKGMTKKLLKFDFEGLGSLSAVVVLDEYLKPRMDVGQAKSDYNIKAAYDGEFDFMSTELAFMIREDFMEFTNEKGIEIMKKMQEFTNARYGYIARRPENGNPCLYHRGRDDISLSMEHHFRSVKWNNFLGNWNSQGMHVTGLNESRTARKLREIYHLNFISRSHLNVMVNDEQNLEQWIREKLQYEDPGNGYRGTLEELNPGFYCWKVPHDAIKFVYELLLYTGLIVSTPCYDMLDPTHPNFRNPFSEYYSDGVGYIEHKFPSKDFKPQD
jgi:hypothetical protein